MIFVLGSKLEDGEVGLGRATEPVGLEALVFAEAETRVINGEVSFRANVIDQHEEVFLPEGLAGVVTEVRITPGERPELLAAILEISGRPLFVAEGKFPFYRPIGWKDTGPDVEQLQQLPVNSGASLEIDGIFGSATQQALGKFYADRNYLAPLGADPLTVDGAAKEAQRAAQVVAVSKISLSDVLADLAKEKARAEPDPERLSELDRQRRDVERQIAQERADLKESADRVSLAKGQAGAILNPIEFWIVESIVALDLVALKVGHTVGEGTSIGQRTPTDTALKALVPASDAAMIEQGMNVVIEDLDGERTQGFVEDVSLSGDNETEVTVRVVDARLATDRSYQVIVVGDDEATPLLAVPVTAVNQRVAGEPFVVILQDDVIVEIPVAIASTGDGWASLTDPPASLTAGTLVAVGLDYKAATDE